MVAFSLLYYCLVIVIITLYVLSLEDQVNLKSLNKNS